MRNLMTTAVLTLALLPVGCAYEEGLIIENLKGTVRIPVAAGTRVIQDQYGNSQEVVDARLIGPVYLGLYPSIEPANVIASYPHPEIGPQFLDDVPGDAYPYGGTTIGDLRFACVEALSCRMTSGRFVDWQAILDWFSAVGEPVVDASNREITNAEFLRQTCYDILDVTSDAETRITAYEDLNEDGNLDENDLEFVLDESEEFFVGSFEILQQEFFWDVDQGDCTPGVDCRGFSLWGWMDSPSPETYTFSTCQDGTGFNANVYENDFVTGAVFFDVLNFPQDYIDSGDWVSSVSFQWDDVNSEPELVLDFEV